MTLIKHCPTCGAENAPTAARCVCGAFLIGVDLTERAPAAPAQVAEVVQHALPSVEHNVAGESIAVCGFADCAQPNPPGTAVCVYCNRPLVGAAQASASVLPAAASVPEVESKAVERMVQDAPRRTLISLPAGLAARFEIVEPLKAAGGEADLFIVRDRATGERTVLKLYRHGIEPRTEVLERVSKAAPDQLVRLIEHGRDEGVPYELLEYCEHGSLRSLLKGRPLPIAAARTLLTELADAIAHLHGCGIVHRDLKPENVLIRGLLPLDLVLTDFGISSVSQATMHYTSAARTLRYSAPEAGSNWVGKPTDYWALGMMLVEALSGRHPFDGLSESVIAHWLVTRPIDVAGVEDARWQRLCRGLLVRDPKARWGAVEIERWLVGDDSISIVEERAPPSLGEVTPYRVGESECRSPRELAVALAAHWALGVKDLKRGMLRAWLQNDLRDQNLARFAADAEEAIDLSDDERLLRLLLRLDPDLPPVFKGYDVSPTGLAALTRKALEENNEARQTVLEMLERGVLALYPGSALQEAKVAFEQAKAEFEQALERGFEAGASRELAPQGQEWQLRMLLFILEPPKGLIDSLRASARRVGGRAAQCCEWYRALGNPDSASPATLAALILLGPPAAQEGMESEREAARRALQDLAASVDSCRQLSHEHAPGRDRLAAAIDAARDEDDVLALSAGIESFSAAIARSLELLWRQEIFAGRTTADPVRLQALRQRIGGWARWRAGDDWGAFGEHIELVQAIERRAYKVELATQIENRRVPYKYSAPDVARMPKRARATLTDVWSCAMPALPEFGAGLKLPQPRELHCPRCDVVGRAEQQESWGVTAYPFSSTFSCHDKVGVQCQTRVAWANEVLSVEHTPAFIAEFVESHAMEDDTAKRTIELMAPGVAPEWVARMPEGAVKRECTEKLAAVTAAMKPGERITAQRLRLAWTGLTEVRYRYRGKDYTIWIPERADALPIALEHPLPAEPGGAPPPDKAASPAAAPSQSAVEPPADRSQSPASSESRSDESHKGARPGGVPAWIKSLLFWGTIFGAIACVVTWMVNWKP